MHLFLFHKLHKGIGKLVDDAFVAGFYVPYYAGADMRSQKLFIKRVHSGVYGGGLH